MEQNNDKSFVLYFIFENDKRIYLDVNPNDKLYTVLNELEEKYSWLQSVKNMRCVFNGKHLTTNNLNQSVEELGLKDNSGIVISVDDINKNPNRYIFEEARKMKNKQFQPNHNNNFIVNNNNNFNNWQANMQNNNLAFCQSGRLRTAFYLLINNGFCQNPHDYNQLVSLFNNLYRTQYYKYIPYFDTKNQQWLEFFQLTSQNRNFLEAAYRTTHLFLPFPYTPEAVGKDIYTYLNTRYNFGQYVNTRRLNNNQGFINQQNNFQNNPNFVNYNNNQAFNNINGNNQMNNNFPFNNNFQNNNFQMNNMNCIGGFQNFTPLNNVGNMGNFQNNNNFPMNNMNINQPPIIVNNNIRVNLVLVEGQERKQLCSVEVPRTATYGQVVCKLIYQLPKEVRDKCKDYKLVHCAKYIKDSAVNESFTSYHGSEYLFLLPDKHLQSGIFKHCLEIVKNQEANHNLNLPYNGMIFG